MAKSFGYGIFFNRVNPARVCGQVIDRGLSFHQDGALQCVRIDDKRAGRCKARLDAESDYQTDRKLHRATFPLAVFCGGGIGRTRTTGGQPPSAGDPPVTGPPSGVATGSPMRERHDAQDPFLQRSSNSCRCEVAAASRDLRIAARPRQSLEEFVGPAKCEPVQWQSSRN